MPSLLSAPSVRGAEDSAEIAPNHMSIKIDIQEFENGISESPAEGFTNFQNLDVWSAPGYVRQYPAIFDEITSDTNASLGSPKYTAYDPVTQTYFMQDDMGHVWARTFSVGWTLITGNILSGALGQGIVAWQGYLFTFRANAIDLLDLTTTFTSPAWINGWKTQVVAYNGTNYAPSGLVDNQTFVPITSSRSLFFSSYVSASAINTAFMNSVQVEPTKKFDPNTPSTYSYLPGMLALDAQFNEQVTCLEQLGAYLIIGTNSNVAYPWDMISAFVQDPIVFPEIYVYSMKRINNVLYASVGQRANIYYSNRSVAALFKRFPIYLYQNSDNTSANHANGFINIPKIEATKGRLIMCVRGFSGNGINGLYILNLETQTLVMQNTVPRGGNAQPTTVIPHQNDDDGFYIGYHDNTFNAIASQNAQFNYPSDFRSFFTSEFFLVGEKLDPETIARMETMLTKILISGQQIRLSYRVDRSSAYTVIATFNSTTEPNPISFNVPTGIEKAQNVEFKYEFAADPFSGGSNRSVEFQKGMFYNNK